MYSEKVFRARLSRLESVWRLEARPHSPAEIEEWTMRLSSAHDQEGAPARPLAKEERDFIRNELVLCKSSFRYWATRYAKIVVKEGGISNLYPLLDSQAFVLKVLAEIEEQAFYGERDDGILLACLKAARQVGVTTFGVGIIAHRTTTETHIFALLAASVPADSSYIYSMYRRMLDNLPWWLRPGVVSESNTYPEELNFSTGSQVWTAAGKSMKGATGQRGQLGRGRTVHLTHLTELSTWEAPEQIRGSLLPTMPMDPRTFGIFESTAKGRGGWWHSFWKSAKANQERFRCVYIPWYVESTYALNPPEAWSPSPTTLQHAARIEETSPTWAGRKVTPSREQLYWYESTRKSYEDSGELSTFLEEYGSVDDEECFQNVGRGVFSLAVRNKIREQARTIQAVVKIEKYSSLPEIPKNPLGFPIPPGYGFDVVPKQVWQKWQDLPDFMSHLLMWEQPLKNHRYVMAVDVADGLGLDRSCITILRLATVERPAEEVAQFVTDSIEAIDLAAYCDAIGRFYRDDSSQEAYAAIETNNHGMATLAELLRHFGYHNHFVWQYEDAATPQGRFSRRVGWYTSVKTRPLILSRLVRALTTYDPLSGFPDCRVNSPFTQEELADFHTEGQLWEAEAAQGAHDDCLIALAIAIHVAQTLYHGEGEPLDDKRRRLAEERLRKDHLSEVMKTRRDFINTDATVEDMKEGVSSFQATDEEGPTPSWGAY